MSRHAGRASSKSKMRLCLLIFLAALSTAAREVPELLSLTDDVSNDGTVVSVWREAASVESLRQSPRQTISSLGLINSFIHSFELPLYSSTPLRSAQRHLLELLVLQRK
jgi:hypothetical protein